MPEFTQLGGQHPYAPAQYADFSENRINIGDIPNFLENEELRAVINVGLHDLMRHANAIEDYSSVVFDITTQPKVGTTRDVKIETGFQSGKDSDIFETLSRRTIVEFNRQSDIVDDDIELQNQ